MLCSKLEEIIGAGYKNLYFATMIVTNEGELKRLVKLIKNFDIDNYAESPWYTLKCSRSSFYRLRKIYDKAEAEGKGKGIKALRNHFTKGEVKSNSIPERDRIVEILFGVIGLCGERSKYAIWRIVCEVCKIRGINSDRKHPISFRSLLRLFDRAKMQTLDARKEYKENYKVSENGTRLQPAGKYKGMTYFILDKVDPIPKATFKLPRNQRGY